VSLRDRILSADDIGREVIEVSQWGVSLEVRTLSAVQRSRMLKTCTLPDETIDLDRLYPMLIIGTSFDPETGEAVFTESDISALQEKSASAVEFVATKAMAMSGMTPKAVDVEGKDS
jgi:hypothetical protein